MTVLRVRPAGDAALLAETSDLETAHRLHAAVVAAAFPGVLDVVPGERTVLVVLDPARADPAVLGRLLPGLPLGVAGSAAGAVRLPVRYDGADLAEMAELTGLTPAEVAARHCAATYVVAYLGFSPGFGYLTGLDPALHVPRRATPRTSVPAGSVAVAGHYSAVYPSPSPGGWRLLGTCAVPLWDAAADPPALLRPGTRVTFVPEPG